MFENIQKSFGNISDFISRINGYVIIGLIMILVVDVWIGVLDRYVFGWEIPWIEEMARYFMIWAVLLAVPSALAKREHIGLFLVLNKMPRKLRVPVLVILDIITFIFFFILLVYGYEFAQNGLNKFVDSIIGVSMFVPYLSIPTFAFLSCIQVICTGIRDFGNIDIYDLDQKERSFT